MTTTMATTMANSHLKLCTTLAQQNKSMEFSDLFHNIYSSINKTTKVLKDNKYGYLDASWSIAQNVVYTNIMGITISNDLCTSYSN